MSCPGPADTRCTSDCIRSSRRMPSTSSWKRSARRCGASCGVIRGSRIKESLPRLDRTRPPKGRNTDWQHPPDPDARITKMKSGRTHLRHQAEHAVDLETGTLVGVTVQGADQGDTTTIMETLMTAADAVARVTDDHTGVINAVVADTGDHRNQVLTDLAALDRRSYIAEPDRARRHWTKKVMARAAVYANRRRIRSGARGRAVLRSKLNHAEWQWVYKGADSGQPEMMRGGIQAVWELNRRTSSPS